MGLHKVLRSSLCCWDSPALGKYVMLPVRQGRFSNTKAPTSLFVLNICGSIMHNFCDVSPLAWLSLLSCVHSHKRLAPRTCNAASQALWKNPIFSLYFNTFNVKSLRIVIGLWCEFQTRTLYFNLGGHSNTCCNFEVQPLDAHICCFSTQWTHGRVHREHGRVRKENLKSIFIVSVTSNDFMPHFF